MSAQATDIAGLVTSVVEPLVEYPDELEIASSEADDGTILVEILSLIHISEPTRH